MSLSGDWLNLLKVIFSLAQALVRPFRRCADTQINRTKTSHLSALFAHTHTKQLVEIV